MDKLNVDFDYEYTKTYSQSQDYRCTCDDCLYFYEKFPEKYPDTKKFLENFGLDLEQALEISLLEDQYGPVYLAHYVVRGDLKNHQVEIDLEGLKINFYPWEEEATFWPNPAMEPPYFIVELNKVFL